MRLKAVGTTVLSACASPVHDAWVPAFAGMTKTTSHEPCAVTPECSYPGSRKFQAGAGRPDRAKHLRTELILLVGELSQMLRPYVPPLRIALTGAEACASKAGFHAPWRAAPGGLQPKPYSLSPYSLSPYSLSPYSLSPCRLRPRQSLLKFSQSGLFLIDDGCGRTGEKLFVRELLFKTLDLFLHRSDFSR